MAEVFLTEFDVATFRNALGEENYNLEKGYTKLTEFDELLDDLKFEKNFRGRRTLRILLEKEGFFSGIVSTILRIPS